jgi:hypothetical protein
LAYRGQRHGRRKITRAFQITAALNAARSYQSLKPPRQSAAANCALKLIFEFRNADAAGESKNDVLEALEFRF